MGDRRTRWGGRAERASPLGRRFWFLWTASTASGLGNGLNAVALPLLATTLTREPVVIAGVVFVGALPWLVVAIPAGAYADRADRPRLMRLMDVSRAVLFAGLAALVLAGHTTIALVYAFALIVGICDTFFAGSAEATLPAIVEQPHLAVANGLLEAGSYSTEEAIGPAIGGILFSVSRSVPFAADAISFVASAGLLFGLGGRARPANEAVRPEGEAAVNGLWSDTKAGVAWYRDNTILCLVTATVAGLAFCQAMVAGILVLFALERLHLDHAGYGLFMAGLSIGNVVGGLIASRLVGRLGTATILVLATVLAAGGYLGAGATSSPYLAGSLLSLEAVAVAVGNVATVSFRQRATPPELQARVANVWRTVVWGVIPIGALIGGGLGALYGLQIPFLVAGSLQILLLLIVARPLQRLLIEPVSV